MSSDQVVGYAICIQATAEGLGQIAWVTQLVVHSDHRLRDVGRSILFSIWTLSNYVAWGLMTANPYAVRALEKATRRRCNPTMISAHATQIRECGIRYVEYVTAKTEIEVDDNTSRVNTEFPVDHSNLPDMIKRVTSAEVPWQLGSISEGWEWLAFTFREQPEIALSTEEVEEMLRASDDVARTAYSRMLIDGNHAWAKHGVAEVDYIIRTLELRAGSDEIVDFGCGTGRHVLELRKRGILAIGIDHVDELLERARKAAMSAHLPLASFLPGDCRDVSLQRQFDAAICLYDVVGSYADEKHNLAILENLFRHVKPGGKLLLSVMNMATTVSRGMNFFTLKDQPNRLLTLKPSNTMESTGNVFNPEYYLIDQDTGIVYRKEQFTTGRSLPAELIVRDRRYYPADIEKMCMAAGFQVNWSRMVQAGHWETDLNLNNPKAKEILLLCSKPQ